MYISTLDIFRTGRVINRFTSSKLMFQLAKQLLLSGKESKARVEQKVLGNTKSMQLDLEAVHRNAYIRVSGNIHGQREEEEMTSRNDLKGTKKI